MQVKVGDLVWVGLRDPRTGKWRGVLCRVTCVRVDHRFGWTTRYFDVAPPWGPPGRTLKRLIDDGSRDIATPEEVLAHAVEEAQNGDEAP